MMICEKCSSDQVETLMWVDPNTDTVLDTTGDYDESQNWCRECECHVNLLNINKDE